MKRNHPNSNESHPHEKDEIHDELSDSLLAERYHSEKEEKAQEFFLWDVDPLEMYNIHLKEKVEKLFEDCRLGKVKEVSTTVLTWGAISNMQDAEGKTAFYYLLEGIFSIDINDEAAWCNYRETARCLLNNETNINHLIGDAPLHFLLTLYYQKIKELNEDHDILQQKLIKIVEEIFSLSFPTLDVNIADKDGYTPLLIAVKLGHIGMIKWLIERGADLNIEHRFEGTVFAVVKEKLNKLANPSGYSYLLYQSIDVLLKPYRMWEEWILKQQEYTAYIQWLPKEIVEDVQNLDISPSFETSYPEFFYQARAETSKKRDRPNENPEEAMPPPSKHFKSG